MASGKDPEVTRSDTPRAPIDVVREQFEAANRGDFAAGLEAHSEDVELVVAEGHIDSGTYHGREALAQWFSNWFGAFAPDYRFEIRELTELGSAVLAVAQHRGTGRASGVAIDWVTFNVYWVRDGKIVRVELHGDSELARAAAERSN